MAHNKFLPRVLAAAAAMMLLAGCSSKADPGFSPANPVNITIWTYYNGEQLEAFNALVDEFNSTVGKEQGITVESSSHGSVTDLENNVLASAEGKVGAEAMPNIFSAYADTAYALDEMGQIADLSDYLSEEDRAAFIEDYLSEGDFSGSGSIKIFPVAKSAELLFLNETDWELFAAATGATYDDLATIEGLVSVAERYYEWTDAQTPDIPNDGRAFFGRDAMANYMLIGAKQLGCTIFDAQDGSMTLNFDHDAVRTLWDNYYVPFIKGYFSASGRFRSDDVKTGNIIAYVGSSSSATFFPTQVIADDMDSHDITRKALESPKFANGEDYAVQQGAGMVVTKASDAEIQASLVFLKWFTSPEHNITFSVDSGYLPVTHEGNSIDAIRISGLALSDEMDEVLSAAVDTVNENHLYTPRAFSGGTNARAILEYSMSDKASADRAAVKEAMAQGQSFEEASAQFLSDECFEAWYQDKVVPSALLFVNSIASQYLTPDELSEYSARYASILPRIVIEITEEECLDPKALRIKQTIRGSSGAFALDDYGSGYSNERSLLELSPNYIKIDLSIIRSIDTDANKRQIVSNTVSYAHQRGMKVVAEGLETADEVRTVLSLGVDLLQGFFLAMPQVEPGGASEESLAVIAEMHSQSDESQISIFGGDKQ